MPLRVRCSCALRLTAATSIKPYRPLHLVSLAGPPALHIVKTANGAASANWRFQDEADALSFLRVSYRVMDAASRWIR